jgi:glycosyltransferase involved in cell wall biosynthesis
MLKVGYVIPEWPGQTHLWIWREISHLREWGVEVRIFATQRQTREMYRARHAFAPEAESQTTYLWPMAWHRALANLLAGFVRSPLGFLRCIALALRLPVDASVSRKSLLGLIVPACYLSREVRRGGVRHLHSHSPANCTLLCMMAGRLAGIPFSQTVNANLEWWGGAMREKFNEATFSLLVTQWMVEQVRRDYPEIPAANYGLGRVGVDTRSWTPGPQRQPAPGEALRVLSVGRLTPGKGHQHLIRAIALLKADNRRVELRIGGDGPERQNLERLIVELGVKDEVTLLGSLAEDVYLSEMRAADVFVLASDAEPMGVVYMEAMACERPTIGTAAGGVGEIIADGIDGLLVPPQDPAALAEALGRLIDNPELRERLGRAGRGRVVEHFDSRKWAAVLLERIKGVAEFSGTVLTRTESVIGR